MPAAARCAGGPLPASIAEPRRCSGAQFDPDVVDAFLTALDAGAIDRLAIGEWGATGPSHSTGLR